MELTHDYPDRRVELSDVAWCNGFTASPGASMASG